MKKTAYQVEETRPDSKNTFLMEPRLTALRTYVVDMLFNMGIPYHSLDITEDYYYFNIYENYKGERVLVRNTAKKSAKGLEELLNYVCEKHRKYYGFKITTLTEWEDTMKGTELLEKIRIEQGIESAFDKLKHTLLSANIILASMKIGNPSQCFNTLEEAEQWHKDLIKWNVKHRKERYAGN